jgi:hypothetical protein
MGGAHISATEVWHMLQLHLKRLMFCLAAGLVWACVSQSVLGQAKPVKVNFETADQVTLHGLYYPSEKKTNAACVLFLHEIGGKSNQKSWNAFAKKLQKQGYAVLSFDFRGHGDSTSVNAEEFWNRSQYPPNVSLIRPTRDRDTINRKNFATAYYPYLINDIAAAKAFLDARNDAGECNSRNLILIGAKTGATLGALWMKTERFRHRVNERIGTRILDFDKKPESRDVIAAVWLSISPRLGNQAYSARQLFSIPPNQKKVPMAFLYGQKDMVSAKFSKDAINILTNGKKKVAGIRAFPINKSGKLSGSDLLGNNLETEDLIVNEFLDGVTEGGLQSHELREFKKQEFIYLLGLRNPPLIKTKGKKNLLFIRAEIFAK